MARPHSHKRAARLAAFSILSVLGAVIAVWAAPRVSDAVAAWMNEPAVELRTAVLPAALPVGSASAATSDAKAAPSLGQRGAVATGSMSPSPSAAEAVTIDAGMRFTMVGVTCMPPARNGEVQVLLRTSDDRQAWGRWYVVTLERAAEEGGDEKAFTEPIWTGDGRYVQVAAQRATGAEPAPENLRGVKVVAINSTEDADPGSTLVGVLRRAAVTIAGLHFTSSASAMTTKPAIVTRAQWGANESWRSGSPDYAPVKMAFVHHTDSGNDYTAAEAPAVVRGVYAYHTKSLHWSDVGYNFLIDRYGTIYEGRYGGVTKGVIGAQVLGFNTGSTGISVIGTFTSATPTSKSVVSLERLLEWKLDIHHVDPLGTGTLVCGYGQKYATGQHVTFPAIAGHRNANYTDCPGGKLYAQLPNIRKVVARTGQPKIYGFVVEDPAISPNGDKVQDKAAIGFTVSQTASWRLEIRNDAGALVRHFAGDGTAVQTTWDGRDDDGDLLPDGVYSLRADATSADGEARSAAATLRLDTVAPQIKSVAITPDPFSPNGDGQHDIATLAFRPGEAGTARVSVIAADGSILRRVTGWVPVTTAAQKTRWDGRISSASGLQPAPEGQATLLLELRDVAGNTTSARSSVTLDRTLALTAVSAKVLSPNGDRVKDKVVVPFELAHAADVTATVISSGATMRTIRLGKLTEGAQTVTWDGRLGGGGTATSGAYSLRLTADGALGVTSASQALTVDLSAPKLSAPATALVRYRKTARLTFTARDSFSPLVKVTATVTNAKGRVLAKLACGWVKQGVGHARSWRPKAKGRYTVTFRAVDQGGNHQASAAITALRVR